MSAALLAVQNAEVLRALAEPEPDLTVVALADALGRDESNLRKTLKKLREEDLVASDTLALTTAGGDLLPRLDVLEGVTIIPEGFVALQHHELASHPLNPRKSFDADALDELRQDILQSGGITSSLLVRPIIPGSRAAMNCGMSAKYWIVAGERRWRAVGLAIDEGDLTHGFKLPCQVREMSDAEHLRLSIGENIQRVDLDHVELGQQFEALLLTGEDTPQTIAERLSKTPEYVQQHVRILRLGADELAQLKSGEMTFKQALALVAKPKPKVDTPLELDLGARRPSLEMELERSIAAFGPATPASPPERPSFSEALGDLVHQLHTEPPASYAAASGRGEATPKPPPPEAARATFDPSPKMRLILLEIAHKVGSDKMARFREGYTPVAEVPAGGAAPELVRARAIGFRSIGGNDEVRIDPRGPGKEWLERVGWDRDDALARGYRLWDAWIDAGLGSERAKAAKAAGTYISDWLNVQQALEENSSAPAKAPAEDGRPLPATNAPAFEPTKPQSVALSTSEEDEDADLSAARTLAEAWTGTGYRFPASSPSLPGEDAFRTILERLGVALPLRLGDKPSEVGCVLDARGQAFFTCDVSGDLVTEEGAQALANLVRIALHVCAGEANKTAAA